MPRSGFPDAAAPARLLLSLLAIGLLWLAQAGCGSHVIGARAPHTLALASARLPVAVTGQAYNQTADPTGGTAPYTFSVPPGTVPAGLAAAGAGDQLVISGTPDTPGDYAIAVTVADAAGDTAHATFTLTVADTVDLAGSWVFTFIVNHAEGICASEIGQESQETLTIRQTAGGAPGSFNVILSGFQGDPANRISGTVTGWSALSAAGDYPEDGGTTITRHDLVVYSPDEMEGTEAWEWSGADASCPNGTALISARRAP